MSKKGLYINGNDTEYIAEKVSKMRAILTEKPPLEWAEADQLSIEISMFIEQKLLGAGWKL